MDVPAVWPRRFERAGLGACICWLDWDTPGAVAKPLVSQKVQRAIECGPGRQWIKFTLAR